MAFVRFTIAPLAAQYATAPSMALRPKVEEIFKIAAVVHNRSKFITSKESSVRFTEIWKSQSSSVASIILSNLTAPAQLTRISKCTKFINQPLLHRLY